jgi:hypothetical protein
VDRNEGMASGRREVDLVGWEADVLAFVEVVQESAQRGSTRAMPKHARQKAKVQFRDVFGPSH